MKKLFKFQVKVFAIVAVLLVSISSVFAQQKIAIIDAGSSGSRLYVYDISNDGKSVNVLCNEKINWPLSKVPAQKDSVSRYVHTMTKLYDNTGSSIDLYVLATAGMRYETRGKANSIYNYVMAIGEINNYQIKNAMTISGRYEGFCAWLTLNYDRGAIEANSLDAENPLKCKEDSQTAGIIEIGGASMQIAFDASTTSSVCSAGDCIPRKGFSNIYCKSYLGGGADKIFENYKRPNEHTDYSKGENGIKGLPDLSSVEMVFFGLGKPIGNVIDNLASKRSFDTYVNTLTDEDTKANFHPKSNAFYVWWLTQNLKIKELTKYTEDASWTKGAALDIVINKAYPEEFNNN